MGVYQAVLRSLLRVFRAVPLPPALTLPLPLNPTPPPASIHGDRARGFPEHLARGFDVREDHGNRYEMTCAGLRGNCLHEAAAVVSEFPIESADAARCGFGYTDFLFIPFLIITSWSTTTTT